MSNMPSINEHEARIIIGNMIMDILADLAVDGEDVTEEELLQIEESMGDVADVILEVLSLKILTVDGTTVTAEMDISNAPGK